MEIAIKVECICKIRSGEFSCDKKTVLVRTRVRCTSMKRAAGIICTQLTLPHGVVEGLICLSFCCLILLFKTIKSILAFSIQIFLINDIIFFMFGLCNLLNSI